MSTEQSAIAWHRFGLGARPGDLSTPAREPIAALLEDVSSALAPAELAGLPGSPVLFADFQKQQAERKLAKAAKPVMGPQPDASNLTSMRLAGPAVAATDLGTSAQAGKPGGAVRDAVLDEIEARLAVARKAPIGFGERLTQFWANHFTVSGTSQGVHILCGAFEREAIRPHLTGSFIDMLQAAESHPAMLLYLNNERSIGPNSPAGLKQEKGLNENLGREILELHTLGVDGGYTQADVTSFANAITGWSVVTGKNAEGSPGSHIFRPRTHEPGAKLVLGRGYAQEGRAQGEAVLADLALHPATAKHIATKLVRHFIADDPPPAAVAAVAAAYQKSGGELMPVYEALLRTPAALAKPLVKLRPPSDYAIAAVRALEVDLDAKRFMRAMALLGQTPFKAPSPQGWSDDSKAWLAPDSIAKRLELASLLSQSARAEKPLERAKGVLGPLISEETSSTIDRAESGAQALALLLMSPEFQRR